MKHKTSELAGPLLDAAVAMAEGIEGWRVDGRACLVEGFDDDDLESFSYCYAPSRVWSEGGRIIERERIRLMHEHGDGDDAQWYAACRSFEATGPTPLIVAMRAYVAWKLGDEVELPDNR